MVTSRQLEMVDSIATFFQQLDETLELWRRVVHCPTHQARADTSAIPADACVETLATLLFIHQQRTRQPSTASALIIQQRYPVHRLRSHPKEWQLDDVSRLRAQHSRGWPRRDHPILPRAERNYLRN